MNYGISKKVDYDFNEAITKVIEELQKEGFGVLTEIDVKATLKKKLNVDFPKYKILGACNPLLAHKALSAEQEIGLLLPCNVIVYENDNNETFISLMNAEAMFSVIDRNDLQPIVSEVSAKLNRVVENL